ncbi:hypothetical protein [uncultured Paraglaciecola sp.]|uniref:hypothetical protein n=1 Tax=uncultured Paraglaciecola sp. TaxID=1765024 RepID=UPI002615D070|nr:hypothetical protein [uncultured Paraglaciecola sp.]
MTTDSDKALANYFYEQCTGGYDGHMATVPNNPVIYGLMFACGATSKKDFAEQLRQFADALDLTQPITKE